MLNNCLIISSLNEYFINKNKYKSGSSSFYDDKDNVETINLWKIIMKKKILKFILKINNIY